MLICHKLQYRLKNCPPSARSPASMAEGDGPSRNFRSAYYEKLGFSGNEEKSILDLLISSSSFDLEKFSDLCDRHDLDRRCVETWKLILGVECNRKNPFDEFANVRRVRAEHFHSLKHHLEVLLRHNLVMREKSKKCSNSVKSYQSNENDQCSSNELEGKLRSQQKENDEADVFIRKEELEASRHDSYTPSNNENFRGSEATISSSDVPRSGSTSSDDIFEYIEVSSQLTKGQKEPLSLRLTNKSSNITNKQSNPGKKIALMYLLEAGKLESTDISAQLDSTYCLRLTAMASFFVNVSKDLQEAFFLFRNFTKKLEENQEDTVKI